MGGAVEERMVMLGEEGLEGSICHGWLAGRRRGG